MHPRQVYRKEVYRKGPEYRGLYACENHLCMEDVFREGQALGCPAKEEHVSCSMKICRMLLDQDLDTKPVSL